MSSTAEVAPVEKTSSALPWALWSRQTGAILRLEVKKNFLGRRAVLIYLLALMPVLLFAPMTWFNAEDIRSNFGSAMMIYAALYDALILRTVIFFGCAWIFMNLFRGDVVDRSLHFYFLSPVRREVLVAGKYISGLLTSVILFTGTAIVTLSFLYFALGYSASMRQLFDGPGLGRALAYAGITVLACIGYGAVFLLVGLLFRNPVIPAAVVYGWEWINFLLPPLLKKISVIHYLESISPILAPSSTPFAIIAEPTPAWISVPGLLIMTAFVLVLACLRIRRMEIKYGTD